MTTNYYEIIIVFLLGGITVSVTGMLANLANPLIAALVWSYPISVIQSMLYIKSQGKNNTYLSKFLLSVSLGLPLMMATILALRYFIMNSQNTNSLMGLIGKASLIYLVSGLIFYGIIKMSGISHYFM